MVYLSLLWWKITCQQGQLPSQGKICHNCQRRDHFARVCKSKQAQHPPVRGGAKPPNKVAVRELSVLDVTASAANDRKSPKVRIGLSTFPDRRSLGQHVATLDTGADVTVTGQWQFQQLGLSTHVLNAPLAEEVMAVDVQTMNCLGTFQLLVSLGEYEVVTDVAVFVEVDGI